LFQTSVEELQSAVKELYSDMNAFTCVLCGKAFKQRCHIAQHYKLKHNITQPSFTCKVGGYGCFMTNFL